MNTKLMILAVALCVVLTGIAYAEPVATTDFQGDVTVTNVGDTVKEVRTGKWQYEGSGVLEGEAVITVAGSDYTLTKQGKLSTASFQGELKLEESASDTNLVRREVLTGKESSSDGSVFEGEILKNSEKRGDYRKATMLKRGKLASAGFQGELLLDESTDLRNSTRKEILTGTWRVSPDLTLEGEMIMTSENGMVKVTDNRRQVVTVSVSDLPVLTQPIVGVPVPVTGIKAAAVIATLPVITSITSPSGHVDDQYTITGTNFGDRGPSSKVMIDLGSVGGPGEVISWSPTSIKFYMPAYILPGTYRANVVNSQGNSNYMSFTATSNNPRVDSLSPISGKRGAIVTISGVGFCAQRGTGIVKMSSAGVLPSHIRSWSRWSITFVVPNNAAYGKRQVGVHSCLNKNSNTVDFNVLK